MSLRIRGNGTLWCANLNAEEFGDIYIDDVLHYYLSEQKRLLVTWPEPEHSARFGQWFWNGEAPEGMEVRDE